MNNKNELLVSKTIVALPKLDIHINAKKIFYIVLKEKIKQFFNECEYDSSWTFDWNNVDIDTVINEPIILRHKRLREIFGHLTFDEIYPHILKIKKDIIFKTYEDGDLIIYDMPIFNDIKINVTQRYIKFELNNKLTRHLCSLRKFAVLDISELVKFKTDNQIRMYEYICEHNYLDNKGKKLIGDECRKISVDKFLEYFNIIDKYTYIYKSKKNNCEDNIVKYDLAGIERRIINPSLKAITKHTKYNAKLVKLKADNQDRKRITHFRIDIELKK